MTHPSENEQENAVAIQRMNVGKRLSEVVIHNGTIYLAGEVPDDTSKDIIGQTEEVLAKIDKLLAQAGSDKSKLLSTQIFLPDMKDFPGMNIAWEKWIVPGQAPSRATIEAKLANSAYKVEIMCIASQ
jgi:enamine deaminase RidA (YjgF/YER057c/UK114 family)